MIHSKDVRAIRKDAAWGKIFLIRSNHISSYSVYIFLFSVSVITFPLHICACALQVLLPVLRVRFTPAIAVPCYDRYFYATSFFKMNLSYQ